MIMHSNTKAMKLKVCWRPLQLLKSQFY